MLTSSHRDASGHLVAFSTEACPILSNFYYMMGHILSLIMSFQETPKNRQVGTM